MSSEGVNVVVLRCLLVVVIIVTTVAAAVVVAPLMAPRNRFAGETPCGIVSVVDTGPSFLPIQTDCGELVVANPRS